MLIRSRQIARKTCDQGLKHLNPVGTRKDNFLKFGCVFFPLGFEYICMHMCSLSRSATRCNMRICTVEANQQSTTLNN